MSAHERAAPVLLTRHEAADLCRCSVRHFDRHVAPHLPRVPIGTRVVFDQEDVIAWLERQKVGPSSVMSAPASTRSASRSRVAVITDQRGREIAARLSAALKKSSTK
jgi:predicted DNA-binding transcriptional regulator AlpA